MNKGMQLHDTMTVHASSRFLSPTKYKKGILPIFMTGSQLHVSIMTLTHTVMGNIILQIYYLFLQNVLVLYTLLRNKINQF